MNTSLESYKRLFNKNYIMETPRKVKIPKMIVTKQKINGFSNYKMFDLKGSLLGTMSAIAERVDQPDYYPANSSYYSFYIKNLEALKRNMGVGKSFIKIAQKESYNNCCDGKVHVIARNLKDIKDKPDIFYRKCGFTSSNQYHIEKIDECIRENKPLENLWQQTLMYLQIKKN